MITIPIFNCGDNFSINCFRPKTKETKADAEAEEENEFDKDFSDLRDAYNAKNYDITVIPLPHSMYVVNNLYPPWNQVGTWDIFIIGNDRTYILAEIRSFKTATKQLGESLIDHQANGIMDDELKQFFDPLWDKTLKGSKMQLFIAFRGKNYLINTFPFTIESNDSSRVIGAILFMRVFKFNDIFPKGSEFDMLMRQNTTTFDIENNLQKIHSSQLVDLLKQHDAEITNARWINEVFLEQRRRSQDVRRPTMDSTIHETQPQTKKQKKGHRA